MRDDTSINTIEAWNREYVMFMHRFQSLITGSRRVVELLWQVLVLLQYCWFGAVIIGRMTEALDGPLWMRRSKALDERTRVDGGHLCSRTCRKFDVKGDMSRKTLVSDAKRKEPRKLRKVTCVLQWCAA